MDRNLIILTVIAVILLIIFIFYLYYFGGGSENRVGNRKLQKTVTTFPLGESNYGAGLFGMVIAAIGAYDLYEKNRFPNFTMEPKGIGFYYTESKGPNWWSYYYDEVVLPKKSSSMSSCEECHLNDRFCDRCLGAVMGSCTCYCESKLSRKRCAEIYKKYFTVNPEIMKRVNEYDLKDYVIGIHYRGTDKKIEAPRAEYDYIFTFIDKKIASLSKNYTIFVATDEVGFLDAAIEKYGDKVIFQKNTYRSSDEQSVHMNYELDGYEKGAQAMVDMLLLAKSDTLFKCSSNLSEVSTFVNPDMEVVRMTKRHADLAAIMGGSNA